MRVNDIVNELAALVGRDNVAADPASLEEYAQDESFVPRLTPWAVVRPGSAEEVQQVVAWANQTATPLVPVSSGGPHFHGDTVPSVPGAVMVDLCRMNQILRVDRRNRMVVIEPGVTYAAAPARAGRAGACASRRRSTRGRTSRWSPACSSGSRRSSRATTTRCPSRCATAAWCGATGETYLHR